MITETRLLMHLRTEFFRLGMDFKKKESSMFNKKLQQWVNVIIKRFDTIKIKLKRLRIYFLYQEGQVLAFMLKIRIS